MEYYHTHNSEARSSYGALPHPIAIMIHVIPHTNQDRPMLRRITTTISTGHRLNHPLLWSITSPITARPGPAMVHYLTQIEIVIHVIPHINQNCPLQWRIVTTISTGQRLNHTPLWSITAPVIARPGTAMAHYLTTISIMIQVIPHKNQDRPMLWRITTTISTGHRSSPAMEHYLNHHSEAKS